MVVDEFFQQNHDIHIEKQMINFGIAMKKLYLLWHWIYAWSEDVASCFRTLICCSYQPVIMVI